MDLFLHNYFHKNCTTGVASTPVVHSHTGRQTHSKNYFFGFSRISYPQNGDEIRKLCRKQYFPLYIAYKEKKIYTSGYTNMTELLQLMIMI